MQILPKFSFYISDKSNPVEKNSDLWLTPLPSDRAPFEKNNSDTPTLGDYFTAAEIFFKNDDYRILKDLISITDNLTNYSDGIDKIEIFLVKHGRFYHPAKVDICFPDKIIPLALNLAVSDEGSECVEREYPILEKFEDNNNIPSPFGKGSVVLNDKFQFNMFLAQWFDGYNEFHISYENSEKKIIVWDYEKGNYYLTQEEVFELYRQATKIMAGCYNTETFEQIQPWHHAAGDFILKKDDNGIDVCLITIRQYTSLFDNSFNDAESILEASVIFFINLSIRMRLDRVDGVKETVWSDDIAVDAIVTGFLEGVSSSKRVPLYNEPFVDSFKKHISLLSEEDLIEYALMLIRSYPEESPDLPVIIENIEDHIKKISDSIKKYCKNN